MLETFKDSNFIPVTVLAPPVSTCYDCDEDLVAYHECAVNLYTAQGVRNVRKITLHCTHNLLYQYEKYGDKRKRGFHFYPSQRDAVEASDVVYCVQCLPRLVVSLCFHCGIYKCSSLVPRPLHTNSNLLYTSVTRNSSGPKQGLA